MSGKYNRLGSEKSPYLLQHARNPVEWFPWGEEAFEEAAREDKPVFLSIGYSTCHWCHVMAHESFEDEEVAGLMNDGFVSVKVDREERPDIDGVYMTVCQLMTGSGGWPLTIVMTPDKKPFFAATYIPKETRFGRKGMLELVPSILGVWREKRGEVEKIAEQAVSALRNLDERAGKEGLLDETAVGQARRELYRSFDEEHGGFGNAPKFPSPPHLLFLLRRWSRDGDEGALHMVKKTLSSMRHGGVYDHVGFGFHRYSTDRAWLVPHFEKMLYDQALLLMAYAEAFQVTGEREYADTASEIVSYVTGTLQSPEGGFYSAEDADIEGEEGKFYLWETEELEHILSEEELGVAKRLFGVERGGNFVDEAVRERNGRNIIHLKEPVRDSARAFGATPAELAAKAEAVRGKLFAHRALRPRPHRDDKILTDWNGLMIAALAEASRVLGDGRALAAAEKACDFVLGTMLGGDGRVFHRYVDGQRAVGGMLDDYAFLAWGLLELYEATLEGSYLGKALELAEELLGRFWDGKAGGFFLTADDGEEVLVRRKELHDGVTPSGNSAALYDLVRLGRLSGNGEFLDRAERMMRAFDGHVRRSPASHSFFLLAADFLIGGSFEAVIAGKRGERDTEAMLGALSGRYLPYVVVALADPGSSPDLPPKVRARLETYRSVDGRAACYVCTGSECLPPMTDAGKVLATLERKPLH